VLRSYSTIAPEPESRPIGASACKVCIEAFKWTGLQKALTERRGDEPLSSGRGSRLLPALSLAPGGPNFQDVMAWRKTRILARSVDMASQVKFKRGYALRAIRSCVWLCSANPVFHVGVAFQYDCLPGVASLLNFGG
jgi:hypothetical protein